MASLSGSTIATTFKSLLKLEGNTDDLTTQGGNTAGRRIVTGDGENTPLYLFSNSVSIGTTAGGVSDAFVHIENDINPTTFAPYKWLLISNNGDGTDGNTTAMYAGTGYRVGSESGADDDNRIKGWFGYIRSNTKARGDFIWVNDSTDDSANCTASEEVMRLNNIGHLGIGTSTPTARLEVAQIDNEPTFKLTRMDDTIGDAVSLGKIQWSSQDADGTSDEDICAQIQVLSAQVHDTDNFGTDMIFYTAHNNSSSLDERMRILDDGNIGIGTNVPTATLHVEREVANDGSLARFVFMTDDNVVDANDTIIELQFGDDNTMTAGDPTVAPFYLNFRDSDSGNGSVSWNGDHTVSFNTSSDYRIKTDIELLDSTLDNVNKLKPCSFYLKKAKIKANGFIAHELQEIFPGAVSGKKDAVDKDGKPILQGVDASKLVPFLVKAIQELSVKITASEAKITASETKITALEAKDTATDTAMAALTARVVTLESA